MPIARIFDAQGWTAAQYDELIERLFQRLHSDRHSAPGVLFNWATETDDGVRVIDVYETREAADALAQEHIGPLVTALGLPMPQITEYEVHSFLTPAS